MNANVRFGVSAQNITHISSHGVANFRKMILFPICISKARMVQTNESSLLSYSVPHSYGRQTDRQTQTDRIDLCAHLDYLFYSRVCGSRTPFPPLSEKLGERFQTNTSMHTHTGLEPMCQYKQTKCTNWPSQTCLQV